MSDPRSIILHNVAGSALTPVAGIAGAYIRELSIEDVDAIDVGTAEGSARLLAAALVDAAGAPLFTPDDIAALARLKIGVFSGLFRQVNAANGISGEAAEDLAKN
jgi:hypothetical protein